MGVSKRVWACVFGASWLAPTGACSRPAVRLAAERPTAQSPKTPPARATARGRVVRAALAQPGVTRSYDPSYTVLAYPNGDVAREKGVCTDVVIRAFRAGGVDLQRLVHEDMKGHFSAYPHSWGLKRPDPNIDHRRVPNLMTFFARRGVSLPISTNPTAYRPGDVVAWRLPTGQLHIGLVSDRPGPSGGRSLMVHNIGAGAQVEDVLFAWPVIGHYRYFH